MNGYIIFYNGKRFERRAKSIIEARDAFAKEHNVKKAYKINIMLAERGGEQVTHDPSIL